MQEAENPYAAPTSKAHDVALIDDGKKRKLFSPTQGGAGAFVFGPLMGLYAIQSNFAAMGEHAKKIQTLTYGAIFVVAFVLLNPFLPDKLPGYLFGLVYLFVTRAIIEKHQLTKQQIIDSEVYAFQSNWLVFGLGLLSSVILVALMVLVFFAYASFGWADPLW